MASYLHTYYIYRKFQMYEHDAGSSIILYTYCKYTTVLVTRLWHAYIFKMVVTNLIWYYNPDTDVTEESVRISEVSLFQRLKVTVLWERKVSPLVRCPLLQGFIYHYRGAPLHTTVWLLHYSSVLHYHVTWTHTVLWCTCSYYSRWKGATGSSHEGVRR